METGEGKETTIWDGFRFSSVVPASGDVGEKERGLDWRFFFFFEWTGLTCFRFERSGLCPWADDIFMSCSSKNFSKFSITTNLTAYA